MNQILIGRLLDPKIVAGRQLNRLADRLIRVRPSASLIFFGTNCCENLVIIITFVLRYIGNPASVTKDRFARNGLSGNSEENGDEITARGLKIDSGDL